MTKDINIFSLTKVWYEYKSEHPELTGSHTDFLFYCVDLNNRLAWKEVFGLPAIETSEFLNISYNTFRKLLNDFTQKYKLIRLVKKSTNQYTANKISLDLLYQNLLKQKKSTYKAFIKAQQKQLSKQSDIDNTLLHINNNTLLHLKEKDFNFIFNSQIIKNELKKRGYVIKKPKNQKIDFSVFPKELIELSKRVIKLFPESVINNLTAKQKYEWIDTLRKLNEIDKISLIEIEKIIKFARNSDFWSKNFLSVLKLRKKNKENIKYYIVFQEEMKSEQKKNIGKITEDSVCQNTELYPDRMKWGHRK